MVDSIRNSTNLVAGRASPLPPSRLRSTDVLTAVQQTQAGAPTTSPMRVFAVAEASKGASASMSRLPRGSLVDILA